MAGSVGYAAAKHGIVGLMRVYANLLAQHSIRVNSIHPAGVNTPMIDNDFTRSWLDDLAQQSQGGPDMGNALPVEMLERRGHRQRGVLAGVRRWPATSPVSPCRSTRAM